MKPAEWQEVVSALDAPSVEACVHAAERIHNESTAEDIPNLLALLKHDDFFIREAAAWPLAELAGPSVLAELFAAYQHGFDQGHDNDGFTGALLEIPALHPVEARRALADLVSAAADPIRGHAQWLLEFCVEER
jgi:hypothetical protein